MMRGLNITNSKAPTYTLAVGILFYIYSLPGYSDPKTSHSGSTTIELELENINNRLLQSQESVSLTRIGSIGKSELNSAEINIKVGNINNIVGDTTESSARTNIGTISNVTGNKADIEVDANRVNTKVLGGNNNHAITNIGVLHDVNIPGSMSIEVRVGEVNNSIAGGNNNDAEVSVGYDPVPKSVNRNSNQRASHNYSRTGSPLTPYSHSIQTVASITKQENNKRAANTNKVTEMRVQIALPNGNTYWLPMNVKLQKRHCLDVNQPDTCLRVGGIPMKLFVDQVWVDGKTEHINVSPWNNNRKKFKLKIWNSWKRTLQGIAVSEAKKSFDQFWKYCCAKTKTIYQVQRQYKRVYTAIDPKNPDYAFYAAYAKRMNEDEKNHKRYHQYNYTKNTRGKGNSTIIIDPYYFTP